MEDEGIGAGETLLRFLDPRGNHVAREPDGSTRVSSAAFLDKKALHDAARGVSAFVESRSDLSRLETHFRSRNYGLARVTAGRVRECGFVLCLDPSTEFPHDLHVLIRPAVTWSTGMYRTKSAKLATLAVIAYLPSGE